MTATAILNTSRLTEMQKVLLLQLVWTTVLANTASGADVQSHIWSRDDTDTDTTVDGMSRSGGSSAPQARIFDGAPASEPIPFIASIQFFIPKYNAYKHFCAGSLVTPTRIATAAHCFYRLLKHRDKDQFRFQAVLGTVDHVVPAVKAQFSVYHIKIDPRWSEKATSINPLPYDFAVINLPRPVPTSKMVQPAKLANSSSYSDQIVVAGWGKYDCKNTSRHLLYAVGEIVPTRQCEKMISAAYDNQVIEFGGDKVCALIRHPDKNDTMSNVDEGDSGGPLFRIIDKSMVLLGITSFGFKNSSEGCVRSDIPQVFSKVSANTEFLLYDNQGGRVGGWSLSQFFMAALILLNF